MAAGSAEEAPASPSNGDSGGGAVHPRVAAYVAMGIDPAVAAVLPEDAPEGHRAHAQVKYNGMHKWPLADFKHGPQKIRFQVTLMNCGNSQQATEVLGRSCFMQFEEGNGLEAVKAFRQECYARIKTAITGEAPGPKKPAKGPGRPAKGQQLGAKKQDPGKEAEPSPRRADAAAPNGVAASPPWDGVSVIDEDAPEGHEAFSKVKYISRRDHFLLTMPSSQPGLDSRKTIAFSVKKFGGEQEEAGRVARHCYLKLEAGATAEEVEALRDRLSLKYQGSARAAPDAPKAAAANNEGRGVVLEEDVPADSESHGAVKMKATNSVKGVAWFFFTYPDGTKVRFQATARSAGGSMENAMRVSRLCYDKFSQGLSREEVEAYRNELYARCGGPQGGEPPKKKRRLANGGNDAELLKMLRKDGRLGESFRLEGRASTAKNSSINGIYAPMADGFQGCLAFEKVEGNPPRFMFFSTAKGRWKINAALDDSKGGFAHAKASAGGQAPPHRSENLRWRVCDEDKKYNEDANVRCVALAQAADPAAASKGSDSSDSQSGSSSDSDAEASAKVAEEVEESSNSSSSSDEAAEGQAKAGVAAEPDKGAVVRKRVCAKMLVRSGLRCACHYSFAWECPKR